MNQPAIFSQWSTPLVADACMRLKLPLRMAPAGMRPVAPGMRVHGPVRPVRHYGSVDVFLEAVEHGSPGEVMVIDNSGRSDEGCIGDLTVLEVRAGGLCGVVLWGLLRDTSELLAIDLPVFSYGAFPGGPQRLDARDADAFTTARFGGFAVTADDFVFADDDGAVFVPKANLADLARVAHGLWETERAQADAVQAGHTLREQFRFTEYLEKRRLNPALTFRQHLRGMRGAIEE